MPILIAIFSLFLLHTSLLHAEGTTPHSNSKQQNASIALGVAVRVLNIPFHHPVKGDGWHDAVVVLGIDPKGNAASRGIQIGDVFIAFNGIYINKTKDILFALADVKAGDPVAIQIMRKGQLIDININIQRNAVEKLQKIRALFLTRSALGKGSPPPQLSEEEQATHQVNKENATHHFTLNDAEKTAIQAAAKRIKGQLATGTVELDVKAVIADLYFIRNTLQKVDITQTDWMNDEEAAASIQFKHQRHNVTLQATQDCLILEIYDKNDILIYKSDISNKTKRLICPSSVQKLLLSIDD